MEQSNVTQTILNTINYIFETLLSSIDNRLYGILDDLTFVSSDILHDNLLFYYILQLNILFLILHIWNLKNLFLLFLN